MLDEFSQKIEGADTDASQKNQALKDMTQQLKDLWNDLKVTEEELARVQDMEGELTNQLFSGTVCRSWYHFHSETTLIIKKVRKNQLQYLPK